MATPVQMRQKTREGMGLARREWRVWLVGEDLQEESAFRCHRRTRGFSRFTFKGLRDDGIRSQLPYQREIDGDAYPEEKRAKRRRNP